MYEEFLGLSSSPFQLSPDPYFMIPSEQSKEALASIVDAIRLQKGFIVMTGEVGTGKTLVLRCLMERLEREEISFAYFIGPRLSTVDFLSYIAFELGLAVAEPSKGNLLRALYVFLLSQFEKGLTTVLIIDEAHQMPRSVLEEIRLLTNFETAQQKLVQIVLVGQPELDRKLDTVELRSLKQRIAVRCHLEPLRPEDIGHYIERRLELAGAGSQAAALFPAETVNAIYRYSQGIPRLVNSICDQALTTACSRQIRVVPPEIIKAVASHFRLEPGAPVKTTERPLLVVSHAESPAPIPTSIPPSIPTPDSSRPAAAAVAAGATALSSRALEVPELNVTPPNQRAVPPVQTAVAQTLLEPAVVKPELVKQEIVNQEVAEREVAEQEVVAPAASSIVLDKPRDASPREAPSPHERKTPRENAIATPAPVPARATVAKREPAAAFGSAFRPGGAAPLTTLQRQSSLSASSVPGIQPDKDARDTWVSQFRRWLKPGLRLTLIIGAAAVVPVSLAMGVYMARHQKTPAPVRLQATIPKKSLSAEPVITAAPALGATPALDVAPGPKEVVVPQPGGGRSIPPSPPKAPAPRATVPLGESTKPIPNSSPQPASVEPSPTVGTHTKDPEIGKALPTSPVPSPALPAVNVAGSTAASSAEPAKEPVSARGLLEPSAPGPAPPLAPPVANIASHLDPPKLVSSPPPTYPSVARSTNVSGFVLIDAVVDETGKVTDMKVISGNPVLRQAAMEGLRRWKYEPARLNGQPTTGHVQVRMDFNLH
jgi:general secretion pathway protein A